MGYHLILFFVYGHSVLNECIADRLHDPFSVSDRIQTLHAAAYWGADTVARLLIEKGARIEAKNRKQWTPLVIAEGIYQGGGVKYFPTTAELLRKLGAEPSRPDVDRANGGYTPPDGRR